MKRHVRLLLWILIVLVCCAIMVMQTKASSDIKPLVADAWVFGSVRTADGINVANITVSIKTSTSTTNVSGSWGLYYPLGDNQVYTLDIQLPFGYTMTGASGPGITGWDQDCLTFQTGTVGELYGPFVLIVEIMTVPTITVTPSKTPWATPTPPSYLYPPSIWPWPIVVPSAADQVMIADKAREVRGGPFKPIANMQDNRLWQIARDYQLGAQLGQEFIVSGDSEYRCMEFDGIIVMYPGDDVHFGVVSPFGSWDR